MPEHVTDRQFPPNYLSLRAARIAAEAPQPDYPAAFIRTGTGWLVYHCWGHHLVENVMQRRQSLKWLFSLAALPMFNAGLARATDRSGPALRKSNAEWASLLPPPAYRVLFEEDTERPGTSPLNPEKRNGIFVCAACFLPLFDSTNKYESGTGWPSFWQPLPDAVGTKTDFKILYPRTEYHCTRCGGHQGHVFDDGPQPTGKRYCNNGVALKFVLRADKLPELRT